MITGIFVTYDNCCCFLEIRSSDIRDFLGHSDCSTTQIYANADTETRRKALEAAYVDILPTTELPDWSDDKNLMDFLITLGRQ
jgi:hypothetical protein